MINAPFLPACMAGHGSSTNSPPDQYQNTPVAIATAIAGERQNRIESPAGSWPMQQQASFDEHFTEMHQKRSWTGRKMDFSQDPDSSQISGLCKTTDFSQDVQFGQSFGRGVDHEDDADFCQPDRDEVFSRDECDKHSYTPLHSSKQFNDFPIHQRNHTVNLPEQSHDFPPPHPRDYPSHPRDYPPCPRDYPSHRRNHSPQPGDCPSHLRDYPSHPMEHVDPRDLPPYPRDHPPHTQDVPWDLPPHPRHPLHDLPPHPRDHLRDPPMHPRDPPMHPRDPPMHPRDPPIHPRDPPMHPRDPPLHPRDPTLHPRDPPLYPRDPPMHPRDPPLHPRDPPLHLRDPPLYPRDPTLHPRDPWDHLHPNHRDFPPHHRDFPPHPRDFPTHPRDFHPQDITPHHPRDVPQHVGIAFRPKPKVVMAEKVFDSPGRNTRPSHVSTIVY